MTCGEARSLRLRWLDGGAGAEAKLRLARHAASCAQCGPALSAQLAEDEAQLSDASALAAAAASARPPEGFAERVLARLPKASTGSLLPPVPEPGERTREVLDLEAARRRRWIRIWSTAVAAGLLVCVGSWMAGALMRSKVVLAEVVEVAGAPEASRLPWEGFFPLANGEKLASGAVVRTGPGARVSLKFKDGSLADLAPGSRLSLEGPRAGRLEDGRVHVEAAKHEDSWVLETPEGTVRTLGTVFSVSLENPATPAGDGATRSP